MATAIGSIPLVQGFTNGRGQQIKGGPHMTISNGQGTFAIPFAPMEITLEQAGLDWTEVPRPGRVPVLRNPGVKARRINMTFQLISIAHQDITDDIKWFSKNLAGDKTPVTINYDETLAGTQWRCVAVTHRITHRNTESKPTGAEVACTFQEVPDYDTSPVARAQTPPPLNPTPAAVTVDRQSEQNGSNVHTMPVTAKPPTGATTISDFQNLGNTTTGSGGSAGSWDGSKHIGS